MYTDQQIREVREGVKCNDPRLLTPSPKAGRNFFICPFCGSGTHKNKTGALYYYQSKNTVHCFSCGVTADSIKLMEQVYNLSFKEVMASIYGD